DRNAHVARPVVAAGVDAPLEDEQSEDQHRQSPVEQQRKSADADHRDPEVPGDRAEIDDGTGRHPWRYDEPRRQPEQDDAEARDQSGARESAAQQRLSARLEEFFAVEV